MVLFQKDTDAAKAAAEMVGVEVTPLQNVKCGLEVSGGREFC